MAQSARLAIMPWENSTDEEERCRTRSTTRRFCWDFSSPREVFNRLSSTVTIFFAVLMFSDAFIDDQLGALFARRWSFEGTEHTEHFLVNYRPTLVGWCWVVLLVVLGLLCNVHVKYLLGVR